MCTGQKIFPAKAAPFRHRLRKGAVSQDRKLLDNDCSDSSKHHRKSCAPPPHTLKAGWVGSLDFHSWQANKVPQLPTLVVSEKAEWGIGTFIHNKPFFHILCVPGDNMGGWTCTCSRCTSSYCRGDVGRDLGENQDFHCPLAVKGQQRPSAAKNK